jgi:hypothetical protein
MTATASINAARRNFTPDVMRDVSVLSVMLFAKCNAVITL